MRGAGLMARKKTKATPTAGRPTDFEFKSLKLENSNRPARAITIRNQGQGLEAALAQAKQQLMAIHAEEDRRAEAAAVEAQRVAAELEAEANDAPEPFEVSAVATPEPELPAPAREDAPAPDALQLAQMATSLSATLAQAMALEERLQRLNAESEARLVAAEAKELKAAQTQDQALAVAENSRLIQEGVNRTTSESINRMQAELNTATTALGELGAAASEHRELINKAGGLLVDNRDFITGVVQDEGQRIEEALDIKLAIVASAAGVTAGAIKSAVQTIVMSPLSLFEIPAWAMARVAALWPQRQVVEEQLAAANQGMAKQSFDEQVAAAGQ